jgi:hypothetical protein
MIKTILENTNGIEIFGIISVCLFFAFFTGMLLWASRLKKPYLNSMQDLPLDGCECGTPASGPARNEDQPSI